MVQSYVKPLLSTESVQQFYPMFSTLAGEYKGLAVI